MMNLPPSFLAIPDLTKLFTDEKFTLGNKVLNYIILSAIILICALILIRIIRFSLNRFIKHSSHYLKIDPTALSFLKNAVSFIIILGAMTIIFYTIPELRALGLTLFAGAGIFAAIIGFASQQAFANIISGIFIVASKPFRVGDFIEISNIGWGVVEDITLRHTVIVSLENRRIVIPNSKISSESILNSSLKEEKVCTFVVMSISYDSDIDLAKKIMVEEAKKHPLQIDGRSEEDKRNGEPEIRVKLIGFGDSSVNLRAWVWASNPMDSFTLKWELFESIKKRFDKEGIEIPFPYRTLVYKKDLENKS